MRRLVTKLLLDSKQGEETQARGRAREIIIFLREAKQIFRVKNLGILEMRLGRLKIRRALLYIVSIVTLLIFYWNLG